MTFLMLGKKHDSTVGEKSITQSASVFINQHLLNKGTRKNGTNLHFYPIKKLSHCLFDKKTRGLGWQGVS